MKNTPSVEELACYLLPAKDRFCQADYLKHYEQGFQFWFTYLKQALEEEHNETIAKTLSSDMFVECDESVLFFHNQEPIGLFMFRWLNIQFKPNQLLSAVKTRFPANLLTKLQQENISKIMIMSNLIVHPDWRRNKVGVGISDLLVKCAIIRFLESDAHVLLTTTRNNRSTNTLGCRQGGTKYADNDKIFGVPSDILLFYRDKVIPHPDHDINVIAETLWANKKMGWIPMPLNFIGRSHEENAITS